MNRFSAFHRLHIIRVILWIVVVWQLDDHARRSTVYLWGEYWQLAKLHEAISSSATLHFISVKWSRDFTSIEANMEITWFMLGAQNESDPFSQLMAVGQTIKMILFVTESNSIPRKPNTETSETLWSQVLKVVMGYICV